MGTLYGIAIVDADGNAIELGFNGAHFESDTPLPIPRIGDSVLSMESEFIVKNIIYEYRHETESPHRLIAAATIICGRKLG
jgi:hypothetical protein